MQKSIIYDVEIIRATYPKDQPKDPALEYCKWSDYLNMGISIITVYVSHGFNSYPAGIRTFINQESKIPYEFPDFRLLLEEQPIVLGFNSPRFDDKVAAANGIEITTNYDIFARTRAAAEGGGTYSVKNLAAANGLYKGEGALAPILWQMGKRDEVIAYGKQEMESLVRILQLGLRGELKNPNHDSLINLPQTNLDMSYYSEVQL